MEKEDKKSTTSLALVSC